MKLDNYTIRSQKQISSCPVRSARFDQTPVVTGRQGQLKEDFVG